MQESLEKLSNYVPSTPEFRELYKSALQHYLDYGKINMEEFYKQYLHSQ